MTTRRHTAMVGGDKQFLRARQRPPEPTGPKEQSSVKLVDLFAGCGGLTLGVLEACRKLDRKLDVRLAIEANPRIAEIYHANFAPKVGTEASWVEEYFDGEVGRAPSPTERQTKQKVGHVHLIVGGPPCQGHSPLNNHTRGDDPKNALYLKMVRAAEVLVPDHVMIENVPAVVHDTNGVVATAEREFQRLGYKIDHQIISLHEVGVPQLRKRHVFVASKIFEPHLLDAVAIGKPRLRRTVKWAIYDVMKRREDTLMGKASVLNAENMARAQWLLDNNEYDLPNERRPICHHDEHRYKSMYGRLRWDQPAQTITTGFGSPGQGRYLHPVELRTITPREAARLQFFPDWFDFSKATTRSTLAEAIGNAVPPKLGFVLAVYMLSAGSASPQLDLFQRSV